MTFRESPRPCGLLHGREEIEGDDNDFLKIPQVLEGHPRSAQRWRRTPSWWSTCHLDRARPPPPTEWFLGLFPLSCRASCHGSLTVAGMDPKRRGTRQKKGHGLVSWTASNKMRSCITKNEGGIHGFSAPLWKAVHTYKDNFNQPRLMLDC